MATVHIAPAASATRGQPAEGMPEAGNAPSCRAPGRGAFVSCSKGQLGDAGEDALPPACRLQAGAVVTLCHLSSWVCLLYRAARENQDHEELPEKLA